MRVISLKENETILEQWKGQSITSLLQLKKNTLQFSYSAIEFMEFYALLNEEVLLSTNFNSIEIVALIQYLDCLQQLTRNLNRDVIAYSIKNFLKQHVSRS